MYAIASSMMSATIAKRGGEMISLRHAAVGEVLWQGDSGIWSDTSPLLFPIVGRARHDAIVIEGCHYPMPPHGIVKQADLVAEHHDATSLRLVLSGHEAFPFQFRLALDYAIDDATLTLRMTAENLEPTRAMPVNFGFHPGFVWPLPGAPGKAGHHIAFEVPEDVPIRRLDADRLLAAQPDGHLTGQHLELAEALFQRSAMILPGLKSRSVRIEGPTDTAITVCFDSPVLALWMRGVGDFICVEPWWAPPQGADDTGEYANQGGIYLVPPGGSHAINMSITIHA